MEIQILRRQFQFRLTWIEAVRMRICHCDIKHLHHHPDLHGTAMKDSNMKSERSKNGKRGRGKGPKWRSRKSKKSRTQVHPTSKTFKSLPGGGRNFDHQKSQPKIKRSKTAPKIHEIDENFQGRKLLKSGSPYKMNVDDVIIENET